MKHCCLFGTTGASMGCLVYHSGYALVCLAVPEILVSGSSISYWKYTTSVQWLYTAVDQVTALRSTEYGGCTVPKLRQIDTLIFYILL